MEMSPKGMYVMFLLLSLFITIFIINVLNVVNLCKDAEKTIEYKSIIPGPHSFGQADYTNRRIYFATNDISKEYAFRPKLKEIQHDKWKQVFVTLPPFYWETPHGLDEKTYKWFFLQKENLWHFNDTVKPITGSVRIIENGIFKEAFLGKLNSTHYINVAGNPEFTDRPKHDIAFYISGHFIDLFQHFLDNGIPHISLMLMASGFNPSDVTLIMDRWSPKTIPNISKRWGFNIEERKGIISAKILVLPESVPKIHPMFYDLFVDAMKFNYTGADKVVFVSRTRYDTSKSERIILNQGEVVKRLKKFYGDSFVLYRPTENTFETSYKLFQKAILIIGIHGGAMYNFLFASPHATVVEIMPVDNRGLYHGQTNGNANPPFAHLAMYTSSILMHQRFYRYYQVAPHREIYVDIPKFVEFLKGIR